jgi:hypothetical protein
MVQRARTEEDVDEHKHEHEHRHKHDWDPSYGGGPAPKGQEDSAQGLPWEISTPELAVKGPTGAAGIDPSSSVGD